MQDLTPYVVADIGHSPEQRRVDGVDMAVAKKQRCAVIGIDHLLAQGEVGKPKAELNPLFSLLQCNT